MTNGTESGEEDKGRRLDREWSQLQVTAAKNKIVEIVLALLLAAANTIGQRFVGGLKTWHHICPSQSVAQAALYHDRRHE